MAKIHNSELFNKMKEGAKLQYNEKFPSELAEKVIPVMEVNPNLLRNSNVYTVTRTTTGNVAVLTTSTTQDFYITGCGLSYQKDALCDGASGSYPSITVVINGATVSLMAFGTITLTASSGSRDISFSQPIKVDRGSTITSVGTFTAGTLSRVATIYGYYDEQTLA